jgi:hypothetical protein
MKNFIYISFLLLITSCNSQDKKEKNKIINKPQPIKHTTMSTEYDYKKLISSRTEYFDIKKFYQNNEDGLGKTYELDNGSLIEESAGENGGWFVVDETPKSSLFTVYKEYNPKGIILRKWVNFRNGGGPVGTKYEYDDSGKLIKETDMDKNYKITPQDIFSFCKEKEIDLFSTFTTIDKNYNDNPMNLYIINYRGKYEGKFGARIIIVLDGTNGEIQKVTCINGKHNDSVEILYDIKDEQKKSAQIYKTYQGKDYTESEWKIFEQEQYNEHLRKTGRADLIKATETPKAENKRSFLADEDDVKPKKKGFWG